MSDRQRHRAFVFSVLFAAAVCVVAWLFERPRPNDGAHAAPPARAARSSRPIVLGGEAPPEAPPPSSADDLAAGGKAAIVVTARRFTLAFLRYEVGSIPAGVRRSIEVTATLAFGQSLLSAPPSLPPGTPPPRPEALRSVALANGPEAGQAAVAVETRGAVGQVSALTELLERTGREWRVSGLG